MTVSPQFTANPMLPPPATAQVANSKVSFLTIKGSEDINLFSHPDSTAKTFVNNLENVTIVSVLDDTEELLSDLLVVIMVLWLSKKCLYFLEMQSEIFGSGMLCCLGLALEYFYQKNK